MNSSFQPLLSETKNSRCKPYLVGPLIGGALYAPSDDWIAANILPVADFGKKRLPELASLPEWVGSAGLLAMATGVFVPVARVEKNRASES